MSTGSDAPSNVNAERSPLRIAAQRHALREVARAAVGAAAAGAEFGDLQGDIHTLCSLLERLQGKGTPPGALADTESRRLKIDWAELAERIGTELLRQGRDLPSSVQQAVDRYRRLTAAENNVSQIQSEAPVAGADASPHDVNILVPTTGAERATAPRIHGLDDIPTYGEPISTFSLPAHPEFWTNRIRARWDNADFWYQEHRRAVLWAGIAVGALLVLLNVTMMLYAVANESLHAAAVAPSGAIGSEALSAAPTAAFPSEEAGTSLWYAAAALLTVSAGLATFVVYRARRTSGLTKLMGSLERIKATLIPTDVAIDRAAAPIPSIGGVAPTEPAVRVSTRTVSERRVRTAQFIGLAILIAALVLPPVVLIAAQNRVDFPESLESEGAHRTDSAAGVATTAEGDGSGKGLALRRFYAWLCAVLALIFTLFFLMFALRRFHLMAERKAHRIEALVALANKARPVDAEPEPWKGRVDLSGAAYEPAIDHDDPAAGLLDKPVDAGRARLLLKVFRLEARLVRYRMLNRWRLIGFVVAAADHMFRTMGIAAFAALVIISVVLPLLVINVINGRDAGDIDAIRVNAAQLFPEMFQDRGGSVPDDKQSISPESSLQPTPGLQTTHIASGGPSNGRELLRRYLTVLLCIAAANVALLIARLYLRYRADSHVAGSSSRFTFESGLASAVVVVALAAAAAAWMYRGGNLMAEAGVVREPAPWYRTPVPSERMRRMLPRKFLAEVLSPERTFDPIWHVDAKATSTARDGRTWDTAFANIADGIAAAARNGGGEVWVAKGIYTTGDPEAAEWNPEYLVVPPAKDGLLGSFLVTLPVRRTPAILIIPHDVHLYGGFAGVAPGGYEQSRMERDWSASPALVCGHSGDILAGFGDWTLDGVCVFGCKVVSLDRTVGATAR